MQEMRREAHDIAFGPDLHGRIENLGAADQPFILHVGPSGGYVNHAWRGGTKCLRCGSLKKVVIGPEGGRQVWIKPAWKSERWHTNHDKDGYFPSGHLAVTCRGQYGCPSKAPRCETTAVAIPADIKRRLQTQAQREGRTLSNLLRVLLEGAILRIDFTKPWAAKWMKRV